MYLYEIMRFIKVIDVEPKCPFKNGLSTNKKNPAKFPNIICGSEEVWNYNYIKYVCHDHDNDPKIATFGIALYLKLGGCFLIELIRVIYNRYNLYFMKLILFTKQFDNFSMKGQISAVYFANITIINHYEPSSTRTYILNHKLNTIISPTMNNGLITPVRADVPNGYTPRLHGIQIPVNSEYNSSMIQEHNLWFDQTKYFPTTTVWLRPRNSRRR